MILPSVRESASISGAPRSTRRMALEALPFDPQTHYTDVRMMGVPGFGAIYLIDEEEKAIVETGTSNDAPAILDAVRGFGLRPADIDHVIVSHIHLDHAGGAGVLPRENGHANGHGHQRGVKHPGRPGRL